MPYCPSTNTIFVHIPKTAGTSIEKVLGIYGLDNERGNAVRCDDIVFGHGIQHYTIIEICRHLRERGVIFDLNRSFAVFRHPLERFVSHFRWTPEGERAGLDIERFFYQIYLPSLGDMDSEARHRWPQLSYIASTKGVVAVKYVINFSRLNDGFRHVARRLGLPLPTELPRFKASNRSSSLPVDLAPEIGLFLARFYQDDQRFYESAVEDSSVLEAPEVLSASLCVGGEEPAEGVRSHAIDVLRGIISQSEASPWLEYGLSCLLEKSGYRDEAVEAAARACAHDPSNRLASGHLRRLTKD